MKIKRNIGVKFLWTSLFLLASACGVEGATQNDGAPAAGASAGEGSSLGSGGGGPLTSGTLTGGAVGTGGLAASATGGSSTGGSSTGGTTIGAATGGADGLGVGGVSGSTGGALGSSGGGGGAASGGNQANTGGTAATGGAEGATGGATGLPAADRLQLEQIQAWAIESRSEVVSFWLNNGPDAQGGFHGSLDVNGNPTDPTDKFAHQQARHLWSMSFLYRNKQPTAQVQEVAQSLRTFLEKFKDSGGQYNYSVSRDGSEVLDTMKLLYAQAFVILSLSEYSQAFGDQEAADAALSVFTSIDNSMHDSVNRGYDQTDDPWYWIVDGATKALNVHMHLLECFTGLYELTGNETVKARLEELVDVFIEDIAQPEGYLHLEFSETWQPLQDPPVVEYGHDLQSFWLLLEAVEALGRPDDAAVLDVMLPIATNSALDGFDAEADGYQHAGTPGQAAVDEMRQWWVQAESMNGLLQLYRLTGDSLYLDRILSTISFVDTHQVSAAGEWYTQLTSNNDPDTEEETRLGWEWKASYHTIRMSILLDTWSEELLNE